MFDKFSTFLQERLVLLPEVVYDYNRGISLKHISPKQFKNK